MRWRDAIGMAGILAAICAVDGRAVDGFQADKPFTVPIAADGVQRATVILDSYSYVPHHLIVEMAKPVELTLTSAATIIPHNFVIHDPGRGLAVEHDVGAGKTIVVRFIPKQAGLYAMYCDKRLWPFPSHRESGMEGKLEVKE